MGRMKDEAMIQAAEEVEQMEYYNSIMPSWPELSREQLQFEIDKMTAQVDNGSLSPIHAIAWLSAIDTVVKEVRSRVMEYAVEEFEKQPEKNIIVLDNCKITKSEAGVRWSFKNTEAWNEIKNRENEVAAERKELESTLKTLKKPMETVDPETGEVVTLNPGIKQSSTILKVSIS